MATIQDAVYCIMGLSGAVVRSRGDAEGSIFCLRAKKLGEQIAADNHVPFGSEEFDALSLSTPLSDKAAGLLAELREIKKEILHPTK